MTTVLLYTVDNIYLTFYFIGPNQLSTFLEEHKGDGIQHIGLHTEDMVDTVSTLKQQGVNFVEPPYTYYTQVGPE
jgi:4-hydroxyphenylpyruvate dioxygenase-like putative hemolysin